MTLLDEQCLDILLTNKDMFTLEEYEQYETYFKEDHKVSDRDVLIDESWLKKVISFRKVGVILDMFVSPTSVERTGYITINDDEMYIYKVADMYNMIITYHTESEGFFKMFILHNEDFSDGICIYTEDAYISNKSYLDSEYGEFIRKANELLITYILKDEVVSLATGTVNSELTPEEQQQADNLDKIRITNSLKGSSKYIKYDKVTIESIGIDPDDYVGCTWRDIDNNATIWWDARMCMVSDIYTLSLQSLCGNIQLERELLLCNFYNELNTEKKPGLITELLSCKELIINPRLLMLGKYISLIIQPELFINIDILSGEFCFANKSIIILEHFS